MRSRVDTSCLISSCFKNQLLLACGPEWSVMDPENFTGGTRWSIISATPIEFYDLAFVVDSDDPVQRGVAHGCAQRAGALIFDVFLLEAPYGQPQLNDPRHRPRYLRPRLISIAAFWCIFQPLTKPPNQACLSDTDFLPLPREGSFQDGLHLRLANRFAEIILHADGNARLAVFLHGACSQTDDVWPLG